jgi:hypothetical protein
MDHHHMCRLDDNTRRLEASVYAADAKVFTFDARVYTAKANVFRLEANVRKADDTICLLAASVGGVGGNVSATGADAPTGDMDVRTIDRNTRLLDPNVCPIDANVCTAAAAVRQIGSAVRRRGSGEWTIEHDTVSPGRDKSPRGGNSSIASADSFAPGNNVGGCQHNVFATHADAAEPRSTASERGTNTTGRRRHTNQLRAAISEVSRDAAERHGDKIAGQRNEAGRRSDAGPTQTHVWPPVANAAATDADNGTRHSNVGKRAANKLARHANEIRCVPNIFRRESNTFGASSDRICTLHNFFGPHADVCRGNTNFFTRLCDAGKQCTPRLRRRPFRSGDREARAARQHQCQRCIAGRRIITRRTNLMSTIVERISTRLEAMSTTEQRTST